MPSNYPILEGGQELTTVSQKDFNNGNLLTRIIDGVNSLAQNLGASAVGKSLPPDPVDSVQVKGTFNPVTNTITAPSENLHWVLTHNSQVSKGVRYFSEIDSSPNFTQPHVHDHGTSRTGFLHLNTLLDDGKTQQAYYLRSYAQYPGSDPAKPTVVGGINGATKILLTGTSIGTLLSSTGSGTASQTGQQGGKGLGTILTRPVPGPKRNVS
jgi:hypothetical protein